MVIFRKHQTSIKGRRSFCGLSSTVVVFIFPNVDFVLSEALAIIGYHADSLQQPILVIHFSFYSVVGQCHVSADPGLVSFSFGRGVIY